MARCKSCGAQIIWKKTQQGKVTPVNPELVTYWERKGAAGRVVTPNGEVVCCDFVGDLNKATGVGHISHFATCPAADKHRRKVTQ